MRSDLEFIFKRIRVLKTKFQTKYPEEYSKGNFDLFFKQIKTNY
jgi:hypothetical protein